MHRCLLTFFIFFYCLSLNALPVGNPTEASLLPQGVFLAANCCDPYDPCFCWFDAWSFRIGFYGDYVFNRNLEVHEKNNQRDIEKTEIYTNAGYLVLNICDRIDIFGTLGASSLNLYSHQQPFQLSGTDTFDLYYTTTFSWSVGARGTLFSCKCLAIGLEGQWFQTNPDLDHIDETRAAEHLYPEGIHSRYREWQVGLGASYGFTTHIIEFHPYAAIKWSRCQWNMDPLLTTFDTTDFTLRDLKSQKHLGYALGISLSVIEQMAFSIEGRFADEKGVYVNGQFRF